MIREILDKWTFLLLVIAAVFIWLSTGLVFTQDEVSALSRLDFESLGALIEGGVKPDYHPALVQVFLYLWTVVVGNSELAVKVPAMMAGVGSLYLAFRLGSRLYDRKLALVIVALVVFSQYYCYYFSIVRPYAFGTFFVLAQITALYNWKKGIGRREYQIILFVFMAVFAAWTHYFSLVTAGLVGLWGFMWLEKKDLLKYGLSCLAALIIFSPHLSLTLYHLNKEGIGGDGGWLGPPQIDVWWEYFAFLGQQTWLGMGLIFGSIVLSISNYRKMNADQRQFFLLGFLLMFGTFSLAYFYSIHVSPVFQYSILIFSSIPFLIAIIGSWVHFPSIVKRILLAISILAGVYGLFLTQNYPSKMKYQLYDEIAAQVQIANHEDRIPRVISVMDDGFIGVYKERKQLEYNYVQTGELSLQELKNLILSAEQGVVAQATKPTEFLYMAYDEFGGALIQRPAFELWTSEGDGSNLTPLLDTVANYGISYAEGEEFKVTVAQQLAGISDFPYLTAVVDIDLYGESADEGVLVIELHSGEDKLVWRGREVKASSIELSEGGLRAYHALRLQDVPNEIKGRTDLLLVAYYWNKAKKGVNTGSFRLRIYPDVKTRYSFFEKMPS